MDVGASASSSAKTERKVIEKNRRNQMKNLYSQLNSLLPPQPNKEAQPLPEQIDEAIKYIKNLEEKLKKSKEQKEIWMKSCRKRSYDCTNSYESASSSSCSPPPHVEIREMGPVLEIVLITGSENHYFFCDLIRILHEEGVEIVSANYQVTGNSIFHTVHAQMNETVFGFGAAKVTERLNKCINGSTSELELDPGLWDFELPSDLTWESLYMN